MAWVFHADVLTGANLGSAGRQSWDLQRILCGASTKSAANPRPRALSGDLFQLFHFLSSQLLCLHISSNQQAQNRLPGQTTLHKLFCANGLPNPLVKRKLQEIARHNDWHASHEDVLKGVPMKLLCKVTPPASNFRASDPSVCGTASLAWNYNVHQCSKSFQSSSVQEKL